MKNPEEEENVFSILGPVYVSIITYEFISDYDILVFDFLFFMLFAVGKHQIMHLQIFVLLMDQCFL
jgi:hypothetical protein